MRNEYSEIYLNEGIRGSFSLNLYRNFSVRHHQKCVEGSDNIGRVLVIEFKDQDSVVFDEIMATLKRYPNFDHLRLNEETVLSLPGMEINLDRRKVYCDQQELELTAKEYNILCLLAANSGRALTHAQIYEKVWGDDAIGNERKAVGYHIWNIRKKLCDALPDHPFKIESVREVGYRLEIN